MQFSKTSPLKSGESSEKSSGENRVKSCHVCGCHGFFGTERGKGLGLSQHVQFFFFVFSAISSPVAHSPEKMTERKANISRWTFRIFFIFSVLGHGKGRRRPRRWPGGRF